MSCRLITGCGSNSLIRYFFLCSYIYTRIHIHIHIHTYILLCVGGTGDKRHETHRSELDFCFISFILSIREGGCWLLICFLKRVGMIPRAHDYLCIVCSKGSVLEERGVLRYFAGSLLTTQKKKFY